MQNAGLDEAQIGIKIARRNINNLRYADDTTLMAESKDPPGFPVRHQLPELIQTPVHRVSGAIQPSHSLSSPSPPAFVIPFSSCLQSLPASGSCLVSQFFTSCGQRIGVSASVLPMNIQD